MAPPVVDQSEVEEVKPEIKIGSSRGNDPIFSGDKPAPKAKPVKKTSYRKRGRKRTVEKVRILFVLFRIPRNSWPDDLDYEMCLYYTVNYIRKDGKKHDLFLQWKAEAEELYGKKFRINTDIRPKIH